MSARSIASEPGRRLGSRIRVVTAASLFDGHDVAINIIRRLLQDQGAEVIHLGHDRGVDELVEAAIQEGAHALAVSSYQGGHMEFFHYLVERLRARGAAGIRVYGGGGGTIPSEEARALEQAGVAQIFGPEAGRELGLEGIIRTILDECRADPAPLASADTLGRLSSDDSLAVARWIGRLEQVADEGDGKARDELRATLARQAPPRPAPVLGFTGTGGSGKSSLVDELVRRFRLDFPDCSLGLILVDPTRRRSGGALLGDRLRLNAAVGRRIFVRSMATRRAHRALSAAIRDALCVLQAARFDLLLVETAGIGQSDSEIVDLADLSVYVMTPEYGAPSQLEKIDMIDLADVVVLNKSDRPGALDALRDVTRQWRRGQGAAHAFDAEVAVFPTVARLWNDGGVDQLYEALRTRLVALGASAFAKPARQARTAKRDALPIPMARSRYLAEISERVRDYRARTEAQAERAADACAIARTLRDLGAPMPESPASELPPAASDPTLARLRERYQAALGDLDDEARKLLRDWPATLASYAGDEQSYRVRDREIRVRNFTQTLSGTKLPRVAAPTLRDWGELLRFLRLENLPGRFPFTAGVFPFKREGEDPARMFAGEGGPERTNRRFHLLSRGQPAARLSTAFDSVTLYGRDPDERPDVYGKIGNSGVSVCTLDDAKKLYSGFDLCAPSTSVSMTINGPAATVLAFFLNAAIDQQVERHLRETGGLEALRRRFLSSGLPEYAGPLPDGHDGLGTGLLGIPGDRAVAADTYARIRTDVLRRVRGTVQADILKEDQAQNTCIFSTEFALELMGDIQAFFVREHVENFYAVSISGYHMAEAGANPITQLAFTLANAFTYCEYYLARGMPIDAFAPSFSFFFSSGLDAEYSVMGRVARRIWAIALREHYGASERGQKLKYHVQTSGRSLHAREMAFNDIRTTLQALSALQDHCNSLHTNAYDEAVTTPTEESARRALAIQLIINRELGLARNENPLQGAFLIDWLTDRVEAEVLAEFERISERGGVLGAMESLYQRNRIQQESLHYERLKQSGELPIIGVNTFENESSRTAMDPPRELMRATDEEKRAQLQNLRASCARWAKEAPLALRALQDAARRGENVFDALMETVKVASLGQITSALFEVGGSYRRSM